MKNLSNAIHRDKEEKGDRETASPNGSQMQNHTIKVWEKLKNGEIRYS